MEYGNAKKSGSEEPRSRRIKVSTDERSAMIGAARRLPL